MEKPKPQVKHFGNSALFYPTAQSAKMATIYLDWGEKADLKALHQLITERYNELGGEF